MDVEKIRNLKAELFDLIRNMETVQKSIAQKLVELKELENAN